jgi:zinc protease
MPTASRVSCAALALLIGLLCLVNRAVAEPLPTDPALVQGQLDNGLRYIVREHAIPKGRATVWIHIHSGSLNETDRQRGIAHYLEHMAFNGSENFSNEPSTAGRWRMAPREPA